jgi:predicted 3-demethylubiquinone-9 3-methyltransferase (glyoxalase superfamily)
MPKFTPSLMFVGDQHGRAAEAIQFYVSLFPNSRIIALERYGAGEGEPEGTVKHATFALDGQEFMAIDSSLAHPFTFTPAVSIVVQTESAAETERVFNRLAEGGMVLMGLDTYPFAEKFGWCNDRFGVSWQLMFNG